MSAAYEELTLCRLYHCTPLELERQPLDAVLDHMACLAAEHEHRAMEDRKARMKQRAQPHRRR